MTTRKGKIARLPFNIREDINNRLHENVPVKDILSWLNTDGDVRNCMDQLFQSRYITEQNMSEWRQGGYQDWLTYRSTIETVRDLSEDAVRVALTDISAEHLLLALTAMYAEMIKNLGVTEEIAYNRKLIVLQHLIKTALSMRRSEQRDTRLKLDAERLAILREKNSDKSPSSRSSRSTSYDRVRPCPAHPLHPKAPEIWRPPAPIDPDAFPGDPDWPPKKPDFYKSGPAPDEPLEPEAGPDGPYAPSPSSGLPNNEPHNRIDE